jgi:hypothetical protein
MKKLNANSNILYVRASLKPLSNQIKLAGDIVEFLKTKIEFEEIIAPHFYGARPFWRKKISPNLKKTTSGALGKRIRTIKGSTISTHPSHTFVGLGPRVSEVLLKHDENSQSFAPLQILSNQSDFSMLVVGCLDESPGFSTVHATQENLGLARKHLERFVLRWDFLNQNKTKTKIAPESPGCSLGFGKFYKLYEKDNNLITGDWDGVNWIFIQSAKRALIVESEILKVNPKFGNCDKFMCSTCTFQLY